MNPQEFDTLKGTVARVEEYKNLRSELMRLEHLKEIMNDKANSLYPRPTLMKTSSTKAIPAKAPAGRAVPAFSAGSFADDDDDDDVEVGEVVEADEDDDEIIEAPPPIITQFLALVTIGKKEADSLNDPKTGGKRLLGVKATYQASLLFAAADAGEQKILMEAINTVVDARIAKVKERMEAL